MANPFSKIIDSRYRAQSKKNKQLADHYKKLYLEANHWHKHFETQFAPGHFYSPYPDLKDIEKRQAKIFDRSKKPLYGIDIAEKNQLKLLKKISRFYKDMPYEAGKKDPDLRYFFENDAYSYTDAIFLFCMLLNFRPKRVIEIGSGYSSALMMDTNENFFRSKMDITFIEPYPKLLLSLLKKDDKNKYSLLDKNLSDVNNKVFSKLKSGDILFIDSTHVSKVGSDVNQIIFEILPSLKKGVIIHIHDVFYPFEYPHEWIKETRAWNEDYLLQAFLTKNRDFEIILFNHFLNVHHQKTLDKLTPLTAKNAGGSIWLRKVK